MWDKVRIFLSFVRARQQGRAQVASQKRGRHVQGDRGQEAWHALRTGDLEQWRAIVTQTLFGPYLPPSEPQPRSSKDFGIPLYLMNGSPFDKGVAEYPVVGYHVRISQDTASVARVVKLLDAAQVQGRKVGLVIAVHSWRSGPHTRFTRQLPDGAVIPDYWSAQMFGEWRAIRQKIVGHPDVKGHPALAWVGVDFGLDDESWPYKPWAKVPRDLWWPYALRYAEAAWELARIASPVPVLAQCATMFKQGLDVLFYGYRTRRSPDNLGIKLNMLSLHPMPGLKAKVKPYWEWCGKRGRVRGLEPGMVPTGKVEEDAKTARELVRLAREEWGADFLNLQRPFLQALRA